MRANPLPAIYVEQSAQGGNDASPSWKFSVQDYSMTLKQNSTDVFSALWTLDQISFSSMNSTWEVEFLEAETGQPFPVRLNGRISSLQWKEWYLNSIVFNLRIDPERNPAYELNAEGQTLGGHFAFKLMGGYYDDRPEFRGYLQVFQIDLEQLVGLLQLPNLEAEGRVGGRVQLEWRKAQSLHLEELYMALNEGTEGRLRYRRDGWLTGNPALNVNLILQDHRFDQIIRRPDGPNLITEAALHNLILERLEIRLKGNIEGETPGVIDLSGHGWIQKTKVPIVLTIPIRGDLDESLDILFDLILERLR